MGRPQYSPALRLGWQRNRPRHLCTGFLGRAHNVGRRLIDHGVVERFESDSNSASHNYVPRPIKRAIVWGSPSCTGRLQRPVPLSNTGRLQRPLLEDFGYDAGADGAAAFTDGEAETFV